MILIYLDGTLVVSDSTKTIKMTKENPSLTKKGEYSLEIEFPMSIPTNKNFFGPINRSEVTNMTVTHSAEIYDGSRLLVRGQGMITSITDDTAKIQVKTVFGNALEVDERYIDELNLGYVTVNCDESLPDSEAYRIGYGKGEMKTLNRMETIAFFPHREPWSLSEVDNADGGNLSLSETESVDFAFPEKVGLSHIGEDGKVIFCPVFDTTNEKMVNRQWFLGSNRLQRPEAMQINLKWLVQLIFEELGYTVDWTGLNIDNAFFSSLYVANACKSREIRHALPHWSVKEFVSQLSTLLNHTIVTSGNTVEFVSNALHIESITNIEIEDDIEKELSEEPEDIAFSVTHNIKYDLSEEHDYDIVDDDVMNSFEKQELPQSEETQTQDSSHGDFGGGSYGGGGSYSGEGSSSSDTPSASSSSIIYVSTNGFFCRGTDPVTGTAGLIKINHFGALTHDQNSEEYTELKICPVAIECYDENMYVDGTWYEQHGAHACYLILSNPVAHKALRPRLANKRTFATSLSVWSAINSGVKEVTQPEDLLQLFIYDGYTHKMRSDWENGTTCVPFTDVEYKQIPGVSESPDSRPNYSLSLDRSSATESIAKLQVNSVKIDLNKKETFRFVANTPPDVSDMFLIRGKKYLCEKVEYDITDSGVHPLMTGYFYEIVE